MPKGGGEPFLVGPTITGGDSRIRHHPTGRQMEQSCLAKHTHCFTNSKPTHLCKTVMDIVAFDKNYFYFV